MKDLSLIQLIKEQIRAENEKAAHATPTMLYGTVTSVAGNGLVTVQLDGVASPSADLETLSPVRAGDRVMLHLQHRHLVVVGAIQRRQHDSGWVRIVSADSTYYNSYAYVRRIGDIVQVRGNLARADQANFQEGWTPGIIPAGYRPIANTVVMCAGANVTGSHAFFKVSINSSDGLIIIRAKPTTNNSAVVYLDGISWPIA